ncbi:phosphoserine transaminase [Algihabitans albus]|uniref:phosphoserine transaminase n=1 Tax=Algihabitans albus TaxID=2164067 RepID=UPI000E5D7A2A|nr:phosphoserine transaminase [Algihabitans albus]
MSPLARPTRPAATPANPNFSSGPCAKRPGWSLQALDGAFLGRSHRAKGGKVKLAEVIERSKRLLDLPADWRLGIVPASDTGAVEMAMWSLLGQRGVDLLAWESFGAGWVTDAVKQLGLTDSRRLEAGYGALPDLSQVNWSRDVVFTWNGTTSGVRVPNGDWIPAGREGLAICDATSAAFAMDLPYDKLDVVTWSWQKVLGGEAAHGMLALSPRAVERLESYSPPWPLPKIFRLTKGGKLIEGVFKGETINTPSLLCVEDALDGLAWAESIGGRPALIARAEANLAAVSDWVAARDWVDFLAEDPATRSCTSICLKMVDDWFVGLAPEQQSAAAKRMVALLEAEAAAYDIGAYRDAPPGLRIWGGATVETADIQALLPWLDWAYAGVKAEQAATA